MSSDDKESEIDVIKYVNVTYESVHSITICVQQQRKTARCRSKVLSIPYVYYLGPTKGSGAKNMQNFGQFFATSDFDREYLRNGLRYPNHNSKYI